MGHDDNELEVFVEKIFSIATRRMGGTGIGNTLMGAATTSKSGLGSLDEVILALEKSTVAFASAYREAASDFQTPAKEMTGSLLGLQTLSAISEEDATKLLDELDKLIQRRQ